MKYVVIVGDDEIIPFHRVLDETWTANESEYASQSHTDNSSALYASLYHGYILTDDYYVEMAPIDWVGRKFYVPDYAIGRLVETPADITGMLDEFEAKNGELVIHSALVTGYDFLTDAAQAIVQSLASKGISSANMTQLIGQNWTKTDLANALVSNNSTPPDLTSLNAHFNHYALGDPNLDRLYSDNVNVSFIGGELVFSVGCHSGLSVDNAVSQADNVTLPGDWTLDWPQAFAERATWYIGNTGFGYGDNSTVALSEKLMLYFSDNLSASDGSQWVAVGQALANAKVAYFLDLPVTLDPFVPDKDNVGSYHPFAFDQKAMMEATLYGLPMYRIDPPAAAAQQPTDPDLTITVTQVDAGGSSFGTITEQASVTENTVADGRFFLADGKTSFVPGRPVQPQMTIPIETDDKVAHGALFTGATYHDIPDFDPVIARPVWDIGTGERQLMNDTWYPSKLQTIVSLRTAQGLKQNLVVVPGQFLTTSD